MPKGPQGHTRWVGDCGHWKKFKFAHEAEYLSFIKIFAFMMYQVSMEADYIMKIHLHEVRPETPETSAVRQDFLGAPEIVAAVDFGFACLDVLESARTDRVAYVDRITADFRHDLIHYIRSEKDHHGGVFLAIKAIYARQPL